MASSASFTIVDYDGQDGQFAINTAPVTAGNFAAVATALSTLQGTIDDIIEGVLVSKRQVIQTQILAAGTKASSDLAQRGNKWVISCADVTAELAAGVPNPTYLRPFSYDMPTAKLTLRESHNNIVWVTGGSANDGDVDAFVTAFNAVAKSPNGGALSVTQVEAVTRAGG